MSLGTFFPILVVLAIIVFVALTIRSYKAINRHNRSKARSEACRAKAKKEAEFLELVDEDFSRQRRSA